MTDRDPHLEILTTKLAVDEGREVKAVKGMRRCLVLALFGIAAAEGAQAQDDTGLSWGRAPLSFFGYPGMVDMPTAYTMQDGDLGFVGGGFSGTARGMTEFQITPRISGAFRYSLIENYDFGGDKDRFDRSFDFRFQLTEETSRSPAVLVGLRDFGGTGIYAGEYLVASKTFGRLRTTGGIGWGRFGSHGSFSNPIGILFESFDTRETTKGTGDVTDNTGGFNFKNWFHGPAALFGGIQYLVSDQLVVTMEYSSDGYVPERENLGFEQKTPLNFAATYRVNERLDVTAAYLYGTEIGLALNYIINPKTPALYGQGREKTGPRVVPRSSAADLGWGDVAMGAGGTAPSTTTRDAMEAVLAAQGIELLGSRRDGAQGITLWIENLRYQNEAAAIGRAARALTAVLPPEVETIVLVPVRQGMSLSAITLQRSDLEELQGDLQASWKSYARAEVADAYPVPVPRLDYPRFTYGADIYMGPTFSNPDSLVAEGGLRLDAAYEPLPGLVFSGQLRQPLLRTGNGEAPTSTSSRITPVRSDAGLYEDNSDLELQELMGQYFFRPGDDLYARLSVGYFEEMYAGISTELLWQPVDSRLGLGAELTYVKKRAPDNPFGFVDYETATGFLSAYYDFGNGFEGQVDAGRYLAGDWGTTVTLDRVFGNGFRLGAYFTLTDVSTEDFGEGAFDKGIRFSVPVSWLLGRSSGRDLTTTVKPINGDGGARVQVPDRLHGIVQDGQGPALQRGWGEFWR